MWDARAEPGVTRIFETLWGTDKLTVSFSESVQLEGFALTDMVPM